MIGVLVKASMFGMDKHITQEDMTEKKGIRKGFESKEKWQNQR